MTTARRGTKVPHVVVADPRFDAYVELAEAARSGRVDLHFRSSGAEALRLARRQPVDAWLVAADLDDMAGVDLVELIRGLDAGRTAAKVAMVGPSHDGPQRLSVAQREAAEAGATTSFEHPISFADLAELLALPAEERPAALSLAGVRRGLVTLPVGIGAAVIAVAVVMLG